MARKKPAETPKTKTTTGTSKANPWPGIIAIAVGVVLLVYLAYGVALHFADLTDGFTKFWTSIFYYPAATVMTKGYWGWALLSGLLPLLVALSLAKIVWYGVRGKKLPQKNLIGMGVVLAIVAVAQYWVPPLANTSASYSEYLTRVSALDKLQAQQQQQLQQQGAPTPSAATVHANALQQLVQGDVIRQVAVKLHVNVSNKEVNDFYKQMADQNQGEANLKKQLKTLLGWTPQQFKQEIKLRLLQEKISSKLANDEKLNKVSKQKAEDYLKQIKGGQDFTAVAKSASSGATADQSAGQPTDVKKGETDPAIEAFAFKAKAGDVSGVIKTQSGFAIVKVVADPTADSVKIQQILVAGTSVNDYFSQQLKDTKVTVFIHGLEWNKTLYTVQPKGGTKQPTSVEPQAPASGAPAAATTAAPAPAAPAGQ